MKILWRLEAEVSLVKIENYLIGEFGIGVANKFVLKAGEIINSLKEYPYKGQLSAKKGEVRKIRLSKTVVAFYTINKNEIIVLDLFDQRQHPDKSKY